MANAQLKNLSATTTSSSVSFSPDVVFVKIKNTGSVDARINLNATATTSHFPIGPNEEIKLGLASSDATGLNGEIVTVHGITDSGTTTLRIIGVSSWS